MAEETNIRLKLPKVVNRQLVMRLMKSKELGTKTTKANLCIELIRKSLKLKEEK